MQIPYSKNLFDDWTKKYSLSKTLRFELKPIGETKQFLDQFIESDTQRDKDYKTLKKIIDEYHKIHIQKTLSENAILPVEDLKKLEQKQVSLKKAKERLKDLSRDKLKAIKNKKVRQELNNTITGTEKTITEIQKKLRKQIADYFKIAQGKLKEPPKKDEKKSKKNNPLFEKDLIIKILPEWLNGLSWQDIQTNKELFLFCRENWESEQDFLNWKTKTRELIEKFNKFTTYLKGFHENRKNIYTHKAQSTAISYRIIHENFPQFLANRAVYQKIKNNYPDLQKQFFEIKSHFKEEWSYFKINDIDELFEISFFNKYLSQEGIDNYNCIIGGKDTKGSQQKTQGINELINQYRQKTNASKNGEDVKTKLSNKNLPSMRTLKKQILSDRQSHSFYDPEEFKNREELLSAIQGFWKSLLEKSKHNQNTLEQIEELFTKKILKEGELDKIYFKSSELRFLSQKLFGDHQVIPSIFSDYAEKAFSTKKAKEQWQKRSFYSWEEIHKALFFSQDDDTPAPVSSSAKVEKNKNQDYEIKLSKESLLYPLFYNEKDPSSTSKNSNKLLSLREIQEKLYSYLSGLSSPVLHRSHASGKSDITSDFSKKINDNKQNILLFYFQLLKSVQIADNPEKGILSFSLDQTTQTSVKGKNFSIAKKQDKFKSSQGLFSVLQNLYQEVKKIPNVQDKNQTQDKVFTEKETKSIQNFLKAVLEILHFIKPVYLQDDKKRKLEDWDKDNSFYEALDFLYNRLEGIGLLYNKSRNYITAIEKSLEKIKINFEDNTLLDGWDINKETANLSVILRKKENGRWLYYLGVMNKKRNKIFDYHLNFDDYKNRKNCKQKKELEDKIKASLNDEAYYEKMNYKQLPGPNKMLPKVFFSKKNKDFFNPSEEIIKIKNDGAQFNKEDCHKLIDFFKSSIDKHYDWKKFNFNFFPTSQYQDISDFYDEINTQGYKLSFDKIKDNYIEEKVKKGELYLFKIYNKDFSEDRKREGRPNLHTSYFKMLFEEDNLKDTVFKLNGQAEVFYRKASKQKKVTHHANQTLKNKNPTNPKKQSKFKYDLIKDKRFSEDKFFFHVPITLNSKKKELKAYPFNQKVLEFLKSNKKVNIIGIDRGERHLAYWTVINQQKQVLDQGSFNKIETSYKNEKGDLVSLETDYHKLLEIKEKERDKSRKAWTKVESIKDLKSGYLSQVVHKISQLMIEHNAIVVFEDLNQGFKRGRMKFEKQVYQKLEKALIHKLNYLVFKDQSNKQPGSFLNAYQLTARFESFKKMDKQTGFVFYTPAHYTSKVCPSTGFVNLIYPHYKNIEKSQEFFKTFEEIYFDKQKDYFVFKYQDGKVNSQKRSQSDRKWKVCSHGDERYKYDHKTKKHIKVHVTEQLENLFKEYGIQYKQENNLINSIIKKNEKDFWYQFISLFKLILQLRHINPEAKTDSEKDYILSPVADANGRFFDSRKAKPDEPKNADANGAYHIGLKGLLMLEKLQKDNTGKIKIPNISNKDWFEYLKKKNPIPKLKKSS